MTFRTLLSALLLMASSLASSQSEAHSRSWTPRAQATTGKNLRLIARALIVLWTARLDSTKWIVPSSSRSKIKEDACMRSVHLVLA